MVKCGQKQTFVTGFSSERAQVSGEGRICLVLNQIKSLYFSKRNTNIMIIISWTVSICRCMVAYGYCKNFSVRSRNVTEDFHNFFYSVDCDFLYDGSIWAMVFTRTEVIREFYRFVSHTSLVLPPLLWALFPGRHWRLSARVSDVNTASVLLCCIVPDEDPSKLEMGNFALTGHRRKGDSGKPPLFWYAPCVLPLWDTVEIT